MIESLVAAALFGAVVPSFLALNIFANCLRKDEQIRNLETKIETFETVLSVMKKKEF
ncbi:hypothetical protein [Pseudanabaena phage PA-SR01]|nr:hypothetical protein [Pseudanabaena phage PA-SR01]